MIMMTNESRTDDAMIPGMSASTTRSDELFTERKTAGWSTSEMRTAWMLTAQGRIVCAGLATARARSVASRSRKALGLASRARILRETRPFTSGSALAGHTPAPSSADGQKELGWQRTPSHSS